MFRSPVVVVLGLLGLMASVFLVIISSQFSDDLNEISQVSTSCFFPIISPSFNSSSVRTSYGSKDKVDVELAVLITRPDIQGLNGDVEYNVTLKPMDDLYSTASRVDSGRVTIKDQAIISTRFSIPKVEAASQKTWELEITVGVEGDVMDNSGLDRVYVSFANQRSGNLIATIFGPAEYWHSKLDEMKGTNFTLPVSGLGLDEEAACACETTVWLPPDRTMLRPAPQGGPPDHPPRPRRIPFSIQVRWEEDTGGLLRALPFATVGLFLMDNTQGQPHWRYRLNGFGSASGSLTVADDEVPIAAKLYFDAAFFTLKSGPDTGHLKTWEFDIQVSWSGSRITIDATVPQSLGPDLGRVWTGFHTIRSNGDAAVGLWDVPHIDVWFPGGGGSSYYNHNFINLLGARSRLPEVYAHEYGHHVMESLMTGGIPSIEGGPHSFCSTTESPALSWVEGYATAFGLQVLGLTRYRGTDLARLSCAANRDMTTDEARVAAGMLDLMDSEGATPECAGTDETLGRPGFCDRTTGNLFTPRIVLRDSIVGPQASSVKEWWERLAGVHRSQPGMADGWEAMRYNYYPVPPCRFRWRNLCLDRILLLPPWRLPRLPPLATPRPIPRITPRPPPFRDGL